MSAAANSVEPDAAIPGVLVSVIMPVYNARPTLPRALESVLGQSFQDLELIAVDDGSTDGSVATLERFAQSDARVRIIRQARNLGVAAARNAGISAAKGSHIAFLDSDDWWHRLKLELQMRQVQASGARVSYSSYQRVAEDGRALALVRPPDQVGYLDMLKSNHIGNLTGLYDRTLGDARFEAVGHEDYVFWLDRVRVAGRAHRVPHEGPLAYYCVREGSISSNKWRAASWQWDIYRKRERMGLLRSIWYIMCYVANALGKRVGRFR